MDGVDRGGPFVGTDGRSAGLSGDAQKGKSGPVVAQANIFTPEDRERICDRLVELARGDDRITAAALIGSGSVGVQDRWSDIDMGLGVAGAAETDEVVADWTRLVETEFGRLHHWDLRSGSSLYRVFLLPNGLELDLSFTPQSDFGPRGPSFRALFGETGAGSPAPRGSADQLMGLGWHHAFHAFVAIERAQPWKAEYWISALRDQVLTMACLRLGEETAWARGFDRLPDAVTDPLVGAIVRSLETHELRRALKAAAGGLLNEIGYVDDDFRRALRPLLQEYSIIDP